MIPCDEQTLEYNGLLNRVTQGDCLEVMRLIPDKSIDMILCDLPYGTTRNKWDSVIDLPSLWSQYKRIIKDNGAIVLTSSQPFTTLLIVSNMKMFRYCWVWEKSRFANQMMAKKQPLKIHEDICVFSKKQPVYNPQGLIRVDKITKQGKRITDNLGGGERPTEYKQEFTNYPRSILKFNSVGKTVHPTQKPVALFEYLIRTYTNEGEVVLDNCIGSGTTAVAAINTGRQFIGIEHEPEYVEIANRRIKEALAGKRTGAKGATGV